MLFCMQNTAFNLPFLLIILKKDIDNLYLMYHNTIGIKLN